MLDAHHEDDSLDGLADDLGDAEIQLRPFDASSVKHAIDDLEDVFSSSQDLQDLEGQSTTPSPEEWNVTMS